MKMEMLDTVGCERPSCDWLINELGPPPDAILRIPPPPLPHFIDPEYLQEMGLSNAEQAGDNDTLCQWCHWARRMDSSTVSGTSGTEIAMEDTWFFVILASCLMLTLGALLSGLVYLRLHGKTLKGAWDFGSFISETGSILMSGQSAAESSGGTSRSVNKPCQQVRYSASSDNVNGCGGVGGGDGGGSVGGSGTAVTAVHHHQGTRALWAGVKTTEGNHYTITHVQPIEQKRSSTSSHILHDEDEDSAGYTTLSPTASTCDQQRIYYCVNNSSNNQSGLSQVTQVTSLDDSLVEPVGSDPQQNPLYVNMSALHPLAQIPRRINSTGVHSSAPVLVLSYPTSGSHFPALGSRPRQTAHVHPHRLYHQA